MIFTARCLNSSVELIQMNNIRAVANFYWWLSFVGRRCYDIELTTEKGAIVCTAKPQWWDKSQALWLLHSMLLEFLHLLVQRNSLALVIDHSRVWQAHRTCSSQTPFSNKSSTAATKSSLSSNVCLMSAPTSSGVCEAFLMLTANIPDSSSQSELVQLPVIATYEFTRSTHLPPCIPKKKNLMFVAMFNVNR